MRIRRTFALFAVALASVAAADMAALLRPGKPAPPPPPPAIASGGLRMQAVLERLYLPEDRATRAYLQIDLAADADGVARRERVPVNAVLIVDRSGSMSGAKMERAREAAAALVRSLGPEDRLAIVEFSSDASVLLASTPLNPRERSRALEAVAELHAAGGTNLSAAFDLAAPQLAQGRGGGRVDKVFLASDGQANEGISREAAQAVPASSGELARLKNGYERDVQKIDAPGDAASKKLKARTFDAVRAPVAGW